MSLAEVTTKFSENVLDSTNAFELLITEEEKLKGLPAAAVAAARASAESKGRSGWRFTLQAPSYVAVMTYLDDRAASASKCIQAFLHTGDSRPVPAACGARQRPADREDSGITQ